MTHTINEERNEHQNSCETNLQEIKCSEPLQTLVEDNQ